MKQGKVDVMLVIDMIKFIRTATKGQSKRS